MTRRGRPTVEEQRAKRAVFTPDGGIENATGFSDEFVRHACAETADYFGVSIRETGAIRRRDPFGPCIEVFVKDVPGPAAKAAPIPGTRKVALSMIAPPPEKRGLQT